MKAEKNQKPLDNPDYNPNYHPDDYQFLWRSGTITIENLNKMHEAYLQNNSIVNPIDNEYY